MIDDELVHLKCSYCGKVTSIQFKALQRNNNACPFCGKYLPIDEAKIRKEAVREATELDAGPDALGSEE